MIIFRSLPFLISIRKVCRLKQPDGMNVIFAGHYATETGGVRALKIAN